MSCQAVDGTSRGNGGGGDAGNDAGNDGYWCRATQVCRALARGWWRVGRGYSKLQDSAGHSLAKLQCLNCRGCKFGWPHLSIHRPAVMLSASVPCSPLFVGVDDKILLHCSTHDPSLPTPVVACKYVPSQTAVTIASRLHLAPAPEALP